MRLDDQFTSNFTTIDWVIVVAYLLIAVVVGLYVNRYIRNMSDYVLAGRSLRTFLGIATMVGTELGLVTVMYSAQKGFTGGLAAFHIGLIAGISTLIVGLSGFIVVPLRKLGVMTIPEFYGRRFGAGVRIFGGALLAAAGILNMGMFLKAGALFLTGLTGFAHVNAAMTVLIILVLVYTILGGMVSVIITDYLQFVVLSLGLIAACLLALREVGWTTVVDTVAMVHGNAGFDPLDESGFGPSYVIWMIFTAGLVSCAVWQTAVMRACAAESTAVARKLYIWSSIGFMIRFLLPQFLGVCALAYMWIHPEARQLLFDPGGNIVADSELTLQVFPVFLSQILPVGLIGLVGAAMLAAFMSTHDSYLLCWASVLVQDVVAPLVGDQLNTKMRLLLARFLILLIGGFLLVWSLWYPLGQDLWDYMAVSGAIYFTGAFAVLLLGLYWKRASRTGAYLALGAGMLAVLGLGEVRTTVSVIATYLGAGHGIVWFESLGADVIGLSTAALALGGMFVGSIFFPDKSSTLRANQGDADVPR